MRFVITELLQNLGVTCVDHITKIWASNVVSPSDGCTAGQACTLEQMSLGSAKLRTSGPEPRKTLQVEFNLDASKVGGWGLGHVMQSSFAYTAIYKGVHKRTLWPDVLSLCNLF
jgi:hypothetical protein